MSVIAEPTSTRQVRERHATHARTCTRDAVTKTPAYPSHAHRARQIIQSRKHSTAFADDSGVVLDAQASNVKTHLLVYWIRFASVAEPLLPWIPKASWRHQHGCPIWEPCVDQQRGVGSLRWQGRLLTEAIHRRV